jgi:hypothetical protein
MLQHIRDINVRQDRNIWVDRKFQALSESIIACLKIYFHSDYILKKEKSTNIFVLVD